MRQPAIASTLGMSQSRVSRSLAKSIVGISPETLRSVPRVIGIAGGSRKFKAISGAVGGGWIKILITDLATARALLDEDVPN